MTEFNFNFGGDDDVDEEVEEWQYGGRNATVFLIDAAPQMFIKTDDDEDALEPFVVALQCAHASMCRQVVSSDQDLTAVVLFNTQQCGTSSSSSTSTFPHVAVMLPLDRPSADRVLLLEAFMKGGKERVTKDFGGVCESASVCDALWCTSHIITQCKSKLAGQNVLLFTCRDAPHSGSDHLTKQAVKKAADLNDAGIDLELLSLSSSFDNNLFYKTLLTLDGDAPERAPVNTTSARLEELQERVRRLEHKQRTTGRLTFSIAPGLDVCVGLYTAIRKTNKPFKQKLYKNTNEEVRAVTKEYLEETGGLLMNSDFAKYQTYGNKKIKLTTEETKDINKIHPPGIQLLGFKPLSAISPYHYIKPAGFLFPDDVTIKGSIPAFCALLTRCAARSVAPVVRIVARANASPLWAALLPQLEQTDEDGCQLKPPGFHVCYLPFADDFRKIDVEERPRATTAQVDTAKPIIEKLRFKYDPSSFENPDLQTHWRNIEALALNRNELEPVTDYTLPDYERIQRKTADLVSSFKSAVLPPLYDPKAAAAKRPPPKAQKEKAPAAPPAASLSVEELAKVNKVDKLTVAQLKEWLSQKGIAVSGKRKNHLVQDVYDLLN